MTATWSIVVTVSYSIAVRCIANIITVYIPGISFLVPLGIPQVNRQTSELYTAQLKALETLKTTIYPTSIEPRTFCRDYVNSGAGGSGLSVDLQALNPYIGPVR